METIRSVLGLGGSAPAKEESTPDQHPLSGQEPASGLQGAGTATDPYDSGNLAGQSGSAAEKFPDGLPKTTAPFESLGDNQNSSPNPNESTTTSGNLEPSFKPQEDLSSSPGLQGHPLPITSFTPTPTAEEVVTPYNFEPGRDITSAKDNILAYKTAPSQDVSSAQDNIPTQGNAPVNDTVPAQDSASAGDTLAKNTTSAQDTSLSKLDEQRQTKYNQPQSFVPEESPNATTKGEVPQENASQGYDESKTFQGYGGSETSQGYGESKTSQGYGGSATSQGYSGSKIFVEREVARIAEETAPREATEDTGPSTSGALNDTTDQDLAESTKKVHLKDKIKEKLHFRKKSEST